ncbi:MAG: TfoX/Sxy family protein [Pseudomonadota bacterium]
MSEFAAYLDEVFSEFGPITVKRMFGGAGVFHDGLMFGLVADDTLYLKADAQSVAEFERRDLAQFMYRKNGQEIGMSYYLAPDDAMEDPTEMRRWARLAFDAALRAKKSSR